MSNVIEDPLTLIEEELDAAVEEDDLAIAERRIAELLVRFWREERASERDSCPNGVTCASSKR